MSDEKLQINIYKIDADDERLSDAKNPVAELSRRIRNEDEWYREQKVGGAFCKDYQFALLYKKNPQNPRWKDFLRGLVLDGEDVLKKNQGRVESFILLFSRVSSQNIYAVTGGYGAFAIGDVIDNDFGIDVISRLIRKEDRVLKAINEKSVIGGVLGAMKYFRKTYNLYENDGFGKIYQELKVNLSTEMLTEHFGFAADEIKADSVCVAKSSFRINKAVSLAQIFQIVQSCEKIIAKYDPIAINSVEKIVKNRDRVLVSNLENKLYHQLWQRYHDSAATIDFDLCHRDYEKYLTAAYYVVRKSSSKKDFLGDHRFDTLQSIDLLFDQLKDRSDGLDDQATLRESLSTLKIYSYDENDQELTRGWLYDHIFGDIPHEGSKYFLIDRNWYRIKQDFLDELNRACASFIRNKGYSDLKKRWAVGVTEDDYNRSYVNDDRTIVLHKITPENIEACDILQWDSRNVYFIHIKGGFGNTMRDLCSQVFIAAKKIREDIDTRLEYLGKVYDRLVSVRSNTDSYFKAIGTQTHKVKRPDFLKLFGPRELVFVLAVADVGKKKRRLSDIERFGSNIAKFSLQELVMSMKTIDVELRITQIPR